MTQERLHETQRVDKVLEDAAIELGSVASPDAGQAGTGHDRGVHRRRTHPDRLATLA
ncbi:MAG: hypothetical protein ACRDZ4_11595 [Egibacteraceae bacterium]